MMHLAVALIVTVVTTSGRRLPLDAGTRNATSGATSTARASAGASDPPANPRVATRSSSTGDVHAATVSAIERRDAGPGAMRWTTTTRRTAASGAMTAAYHQERPMPASLRAPGLPGVSIRTSAPA